MKTALGCLLGLFLTIMLLGLLAFFFRINEEGIDNYATGLKQQGFRGLIKGFAIGIYSTLFGVATLVTGGSLAWSDIRPGPTHDPSRGSVHVSRDKLGRTVHTKEYVNFIPAGCFYGGLGVLAGGYISVVALRLTIELFK